MAGRAQPVSKKKVLVAAGSIMVLVAVVTAVAVSASQRNGLSSGDGGGRHRPISTTSKSIEAFCAPTDHKEECVSSLSNSAGANETDPKKLLDLTFGIAIDRLRGGLKRSLVLRAAAEDPRTKAALDCCKELLDDSIAEIKASVSKFGEFEMAKVDGIVDDLKVWLSAALTYQGTCLEGFEGTAGHAAAGMAKALDSSIKLTSNTLAVVDEMSKVLDSLEIPSSINRRRMLFHFDGKYPEWIGRSQRRMLEALPLEIVPDLTVAQDGSGDFTNITDAINAVPMKKNVTFVVYVKAGLYNEKVEVPRNTWNLMMIGDGPTKTVVSGSLNYGDGVPTFHTAPFAVRGDQFSMRDIGVSNMAGPGKHQAVALRVQADRSVFYRCRFDGYQDTLYVHTKRQFYRECTISGTIDFIFGDSPAVFQNCLMLLRKPMPNQKNIVTAQGRKEFRQPTGLVLHNCTITAEAPLKEAKAEFKSYLGRPWKEFSRTIIMQSQIDDVIHPDGWLPWTGDFALDTCFYAEIDNRGGGSNKSMRVAWKGIKELRLSDAEQFLVERFIQGDTWLPETGVPFITGLL